jgi:3-oxoacyl-[acyl-carrier-protein] synthase II
MREAAGNLAIGEALQVIRRGHADLMIAGATGTRLHPMKAVHAAQIEELAEPNDKSPTEASRPFAVDRRGAVLGEGAGVVILEEATAAQARGAQIYGEVVGAGSSTVTDRRLVARRELALSLAMRSALQQAAATPADVGHIQAHGLSTRSCDIDEARAIRSVFGERTSKLPVTAAKSYFGNLGAGSGVVELIAGLLALRHGRLFPVLNLSAIDPDCAIHAIRPGEEAAAGTSFLNLSVTPQGQASCTFIRRWSA